MTDKSLLDKLLDGDDPPISYADLHGVLNGVAGCNNLPPEPEDGPYRTWRYEGAGLLTVRDNGQKPMYPRSIKKAAKFLRKVKKEGGI